MHCNIVTLHKNKRKLVSDASLSLLLHMQRGNLESLQSFLEGQGPDGAQHSDSQASAAENESVHRKMLALMALDRPEKQGGR